MEELKKQAYELAEAILNSHFFEGGRLSNYILERATALKELEEREEA